jgi:hypothetical protein
MRKLGSGQPISKPIWTDGSKERNGECNTSPSMLLFYSSFFEKGIIERKRKAEIDGDKRQPPSRRHLEDQEFQEA